MFSPVRMVVGFDVKEDLYTGLTVVFKGLLQLISSRMG